jgi:NAD(P)-dependent dehydrogenase (short-subunit alcohol dehydrogenase family)
VPDRLDPPGSPVAVVTGGASGIGAACVERLSADGFVCVVADVRAEPPVDVADEASCRAFADAVARQHGRVDALVLAAGIVLDGPAPLLDAPLATWHRVLDVNLTGVLLTARALVPLMPDGGSIVVITSGEFQHATVGNGAYCVAKAGAWMLTKTLALELAPRRIRVNAVAPGFIDTPMTAPFLSVAGRRDKLAERTPLGRVGSAADVAAAVSYLCGPDAGFVTGTTLWVDGGIATNER